MLRHRSFLYLLALFVALGIPVHLHAQSVSNSGSIVGTVTDTTGAVVPGATVTISNPISEYTRVQKTDADGRYQFVNVPFNNYHTTVVVSGFNSSEQDAAVRTSVPVNQHWKLVVAGSSTTVEVSSNGGDLINNTPNVSTNVDSSAITKIPTEGNGNALSSLITLATPGIAADSNGMFHPQGEHADTSFSVDGQPITDQQSRQFSNQLSLSSIQSMQVISGVAPAEYGDKASLVINTVTKSGLASGRPHGSLAYSYGTFGTSNVDASVGAGNAKYGSFTAIDGVDSGRFLDTPEFVPLHDHGNVTNIFERLDYQPNEKDSLHLNINLSRSWAQIPNQFDQNAVGQDQKQEIKSFDVAPTYTHLFNQYALLSSNLWVRQDQVHYYPSSNIYADTPATLTDTRRLTNFGSKTDLTYARGIHNFKGGLMIEQTPLTEAFSIGITSPSYNAPCLNSNGTPITDPSVTLPCNGVGEQPNPNYQSGEAQYDLTRGGTIAHLGGTTDIKEEALYLEDEIHWHNWTGSAGVRADNYNGIVSRSMVEPRAGIGYNIQKTNTVLRASYGKFFLTPYNENLIVSSSTGLGGLANNLGAYGQTPLKPAKRNMFSTGFQQAFGNHLAVTADYFWKFTDRDYDFDAILNTPLAFPIQWKKSKIDGYGIRVNLTNIRGFSAYSVLGHTRSRFFGPEVGGIIFNNPTNSTSLLPFRIDHDQNFQQTTHFQFQPKANGPWYGFNWTYESGMVAGNAPFATDSTTPVDLSYLTPDQQQQSEITCGGVRATLNAPLSSCAPDQLSSPLLRIPKPGTENADKNPPRIAPRNLIDMSVGWDNLLRRNRYKTSVTFTAVNLTNKYALYNFLSTFSGTHSVAPRTFTGQVTFNF
ncbi:MAG: carboxypeptidase regulatory-like domain-containing protein [Acidobacteriaceae bacterium]